MRIGLHDGPHDGLPPCIGPHNGLPYGPSSFPTCVLIGVIIRVFFAAGSVVDTSGFKSRMWLYRACRRIHRVIFLGVETLLVTFCVGSSAAFVLTHPSLPGLWI